MPERRTITLEPYRGQLAARRRRTPASDSLVAEYSAIDAMPTLEELGRRKGIPVGALVAFVLARYCASGSEALLYTGPVVVRQMDEIDPEGRGRPAPTPLRLDAYRALSRDRVVAQGSAGGLELAARRLRVPLAEP